MGLELFQQTRHTIKDIGRRVLRQKENKSGSLRAGPIFYPRLYERLRAWKENGPQRRRKSASRSAGSIPLMGDISRRGFVTTFAPPSRVLEPA